MIGVAIPDVPPWRSSNDAHIVSVGCTVASVPVMGVRVPSRPCAVPVTVPLVKY